MQNNYTLIADSGSTKADWLVLDASGQSVDTFSTIGLNPYFQTSEDALRALNGNPKAAALKGLVSRVYFYGAGCSSPAMNEIIRNGIRSVFTEAEVTVDHDLTACAFALYQGRPLCATIIGTGSNACFFDGKKIIQEVPSLAYVLGDEASGSFLGKKLLAAFFYRQLPADIAADFQKEYALDKEMLLQKVYREPSPNVFLASFVPFVLRHRLRPDVKAWITEGFELFLKNHVLRYRDSGMQEVGFVGSVARLFSEELEEVMTRHQLPIGQIIQKPIDRLGEYHRLYLLH